MNGIIPRSFIDELLNRIDVVELIDSYVPLKKQGLSFVACCPFHQEKTPSFNVIAKKQFYHCFGCGVSGNAISFGMSYLHMNFPDVIDMLAARVGMLVPREGNTEKYQQSQSLYQLLEDVSVFYQKQLKQDALLYIKQRGIDDTTAQRFQLGYSPPGWHTLEAIFQSKTPSLIASGMLVQREDGKIYDRYRHRIMYPIHNRNGQIIGFGGRTIDPQQKPKYLNSPETVLFQKHRELYGLHQVIRESNTIANIIIVEGYMDVIALAQHGINNAVATLGTATSAYHIQRLSKHTQQLIFCFDGDAAGKQAAWRALENSLPYLNTGLDASFIFLPDGHDPDSLVRSEGPERFLTRVNQATPLPQFFFETLMQSIDIKSLGGKNQLINLIKPYLIKMNEGPYQQLILNELARFTRIDTDRLRQLTKAQSHDDPFNTPLSIQRTPERIAVALILQNPSIYLDNIHLFTDEWIGNLQHETLKTLLKYIAEQPSIHTGMLIEKFRNTSEFEAMSKLAVWDHMVPDEALTRECMDILRFLNKQEKEHEIQLLIIKSRQSGLIEAERHQLQQMLKQRHQSSIDMAPKE